MFDVKVHRFQRKTGKHREPRDFESPGCSVCTKRSSNMLLPNGFWHRFVRLFWVKFGTTWHNLMVLGIFCYFWYVMTLTCEAHQSYQRATRGNYWGGFCLTEFWAGFLRELKRVGWGPAPGGRKRKGERGEIGRKSGEKASNILWSYYDLIKIYRPLTGTERIWENEYGKLMQIVLACLTALFS